MKVQLRVVAERGTAAGFALAGIPTVEAESSGAGVERLAGLLDDATVGVVLLEERMHRALPDEIKRRLARLPLPIVVPFPAPVWAEGPVVDQYIVELLRQVIGYRVRLR